MKAFQIGEKVKVVDGPWCDFDATVKEVIATQNKVRAALSIFGRDEIIEFDAAQLKANLN